MMDNQVTKLKGYRSYLVNNMSSLLALDLSIITDEERFPILKPTPNSTRSDRFQPLSFHMKLRMPIYHQSSTANEHLLRTHIDLY